MSAHPNNARRCPGGQAALMLAALCLGFALPATLSAADGNAAHRVHITRQPPACSNPTGMPIIPNDPGALVTADGTRCHTDESPAFELWLPEDRYVWLEHHERDPEAWAALGPGVDPSAREQPPLGLRLSASGGAWRLELRQGRSATLTRLEAGSWQPVRTPDRQPLWIRLEGVTR